MDFFLNNARAIEVREPLSVSKESAIRLLDQSDGGEIGETKQGVMNCPCIYRAKMVEAAGVEPVRCVSLTQ